MQEIPISITKVFEFILFCFSGIIIKNVIPEHRAQLRYLFANEFLKLFI